MTLLYYLHQVLFCDGNVYATASMILIYEYKFVQYLWFSCIVLLLSFMF